MIRVAIIDDHTLFRLGLARLVNSFTDCEVTFQASNGQDLLDKLRAGNNADLLLLDLNMPIMGGLEAIEILTEEYPTLKILVISMHDDVPFIVQAMKKGAQGYLLKDVEAPELKNAIEKVMSIGYYLNDQLSRILIEGITSGKNQNRKSISTDLSQIELEILELICQGLTSQEVADKLFRSRRTVEGHKQRLLDKTETNNTPGLVAWAFRNGIVE